MNKGIILFLCLVFVGAVHADVSVKARLEKAKEKKIEQKDLKKIEKTEKKDVFKRKSKIKDCKYGFNCFLRAASECSPAKMLIRTIYKDKELRKHDVFVRLQLVISGQRKDKCQVSVWNEEVKVSPKREYLKKRNASEYAALKKRAKKEQEDWRASKGVAANCEVTPKLLIKGIKKLKKKPLSEYSYQKGMCQGWMFFSFK